MHASMNRGLLLWGKLKIGNGCNIIEINKLEVYAELYIENTDEVRK